MSNNDIDKYYPREGYLRPIRNLSNAKYKCLFNKDILDDVTLKFGEHQLLAHKQILSEASPVFQAMFCSAFKEGQQPVVELHDDDSFALEDMIRWIYGYDLKSLPSRFGGAFGDGPWGLINISMCSNKYAVKELENGVMQHLDHFLRRADLDTWIDVVNKVILDGMECSAEIRTLVGDVCAAECVRLLRHPAWCDLMLENSVLVEVVFLNDPGLASAYNCFLRQAFCRLVAAKDATFFAKLIDRREEQLRNTNSVVVPILADAQVKEAIAKNKELMVDLLRRL